MFSLATTSPVSFLSDHRMMYRRKNLSHLYVKEKLMMVIGKTVMLQRSLSLVTRRSRLIRLFSSEDKHRLFREQMEQLKEEREELFGFTDQEQEAWSSRDSVQSSDLLEQVNAARRQESVQEQPGYTLVPPMEQEEPKLSHYDDTPSFFPDGGQPMPRDHSRSRPVSTGPSGYTLVPPVEETPSDTAGSESQPFTHLSPDGSSVQMVDVGEKKVTTRKAVAQSTVVFPDEVVQHGLSSKKGPIFETAIVAGIMAAK